MAVYELKAEVRSGSIEFLEELLAQLEDQRLMLLEDKPAGLAWVTGYFESGDEATAAWKRLAGMPGDSWRKGEPEVRALPDADWRNSYKAHFKASKFGRLNWVPVWERETFVLEAGEAVLWLDPGMAFGTGNHETTRLCCERLAAFAVGRGHGGRVIDAGCGSGILSLSAAKLGFQQITGFDNDPEAIRVSEENAGLNGLGGRVDFFVGDLVTGLAGRQAELVMANIQADVLMRFSAELCAAVAPGGELVLSGILSQELDEVRKKLADTAKGWRQESRTLGEWSDLRLVR
jgi:ribosomal protein L11 methyltransferase